MYNVSITSYLDGCTIKIYDEIISNHAIEPKWVVEPFTNSFVRDMGVISDREENLKKSLSRTHKKIKEYCRMVQFDYFATFTFNPELINRCDYDLVSKKIRIFLSNLKAKNPDMLYLVVPEYHKDKKSVHFHGLFKNIPNANLRYSGKKDKHGNKIYNIDSFKWGFSTIKNIDNPKHVASYICKYISKDNAVVKSNKQRYFVSKGIEKADTKHFCIPYWQMDTEIAKIIDSLGLNVVDIKNINGYYSFKKIELE